MATIIGFRDIHIERSGEPDIIEITQDDAVIFIPAHVVEIFIRNLRQAVKDEGEN